MQTATHLDFVSIQILQPIEDGPFGRVFTLQDPEGYAITLHGATEL